MRVTVSQRESRFDLEQAGRSAFACRNALTAFEAWLTGGAGADIYVGSPNVIGHDELAVDDPLILVAGSHSAPAIGPEWGYGSWFVCSDGLEGRETLAAGSFGYEPSLGLGGYLGSLTPTVDGPWGEMQIVEPPSGLDSIRSWDWEYVKGLLWSSPPEAIVLEMERSVGAGHLGTMYGQRRDQRMRYLAENGMGDDEVGQLVAAVVGWLDDAEMSRLYSLAGRLAPNKRGVAELLAAWLDGQSLARLASLVSEAGFTDHVLALAYALCHALTVARSAYRAESLATDPVPLVVPGVDAE